LLLGTASKKDRLPRDKRHEQISVLSGAEGVRTFSLMDDDDEQRETRENVTVDSQIQKDTN